MSVKSRVFLVSTLSLLFVTSALALQATEKDIRASRGDGFKMHQVCSGVFSVDLNKEQDLSRAHRDRAGVWRCLVPG